MHGGLEPLQRKEYSSRTPLDTCRIADEIALTPGLVIALIGPLGAGKTTFVQALGKRLNIRDHVVSPTFTLVNEYREGAIPLYHIDLYRIISLEDAINTGLQEYLPSKDGITAVEWADHIPGLMPELAVEVRFEFDENRERKIVLSDIRIS